MQYKIKHQHILKEFIKKTNAKILGEWAIDCLNCFHHIYNELFPNDSNPQNTIKILKRWISNDIAMLESQKYCWSILKMARDIESKNKVSCQILRASSHCLTT